MAPFKGAIFLNLAIMIIMKNFAYTEDDILKYGCYVCNNKYSKPKNIIDKKDQFLISARFKEEFLSNNSDLNRKGENLIPVFFVYESDILTKKEQLAIANNVINNTYFSRNIFTVTDSGSKSIHILIYIDKEWQEEVAKDFKWYWKAVAIDIFGKENIKNLDRACASIGRLTRLPGGIRDNNVLQRCFYKNENVEGLNMKKYVTQHKFYIFLENEKSKINIEKSKIMSKAVIYNVQKEEIDEIKKLQNMKNSEKCSDAFLVFYDGIINGNFPSGADYFSAIKSAKARGFSPDLIFRFFSEAKARHPSNLPKNFKYYF